MKDTHHNDPQTITLAKLCEALASGRLHAQMENGMYVIRKNDVRRLLRASMPDLTMRARPVPVYVREAS